MALNTKDEKVILIKDLSGEERVIIEKGVVGPASEHVLSILKTAESADVITTVDTYQEIAMNLMSGQYKFVQKALFVKDMQGATVPAAPGRPETITFKKGESALVYYDDDVQGNGFGRPHWLKFLNDNTLQELSITFVSTANQLNGRSNGCWYFVENMEGTLGFSDYSSALVYKWGDGHYTAFRTSDDGFIDGSKIDTLHAMAFTPLAPMSQTPGASEAIFAFGNLSDTDTRTRFTTIAQEGQWGTATIDGVRYLFNVLSGDSANGFEVSGFRIIDNGTDKAFEPINGSIKGAVANPITMSTGTILGTQTLTANYTSQVDNLKAITDLSDLTPGLTKEYTFTNGLTTDTVGGCLIAMNYSVGGEVRTKTQSFDLRGWDKSKPLYLPVTYHSNTTHLWVELKMEAVAGDKTKYSLTNAASGAGSNQMNAFGVAAIQFIEGGN